MLRRRVAGSRLATVEGATEDDQVLGDERVHDDDEDERYDECQDRVEQVDDVHKPVIIWQEVASGLAFRPAVCDASREEGVDVTGESGQCQDRDDDFSSADGTHVRPLQRVLDSDETLDGERHRQPNAEAGADAAAVDERLAKALAVEQVDSDVIEPDDQQRQQETQVGQGQRRKVIAGTAQLEVRPRKHQEAESIAHHTEDDDDGQVIKVEEIETLERECEARRHVHSGRRVGDRHVRHSRATRVHSAFYALGSAPN